MEIVNTIKLLKELKKVEPQGFEVTVKYGILSTTKAVYFQKGLVYIFLMEYDFVFDPEVGLTENEFKNHYEKWSWKIEQIIG